MLPVKADPAISPLPEAQQQRQCDAGQGAGGQHPAHSPAEPEPPAGQQRLDHRLACGRSKEEARLIAHPQPCQRHTDHPFKRQGAEHPAHIRKTGFNRQPGVYHGRQHPEQHQTGQGDQPDQTKHAGHYLLAFLLIFSQSGKTVEGIHQPEA
ncbi:hypothetical protein D3C77_501790 [compost metagenome]